ncbi:uncharacterized protein CYBJADRAFT_72948 [Cyberlindnera jadinii NRRL Y-1542]|uniref:Uncharacterized protein n=1 Tax=Cyberlindnera jadinii (strain ATCC 18201 / CBS 1600 / BCRC 20928 / JCM 3617 / NBRC 0987 / NRRL Y-1542) TaxID=983966 RepID=A0A1E4S4C3_CYBJN|nr:hypothetical protein CYBJADRAFT_72948 [Cyberlindnera jadinii NRRL Y-1542]ODV74377.1 hypothetical protein CYBJADRAFT_72948 [Cyberlindnera jadinii NRRL Y-1542]
MHVAFRYIFVSLSTAWCEDWPCKSLRLLHWSPCEKKTRLWAGIRTTLKLQSPMYCFPSSMSQLPKAIIILHSAESR